MQLLADFLPLVFFFAAYLYDDIYFAVGVLMVAMPVGLALKTYWTKKLDKIYLGSTIFLLVLGGATLFFSQSPLSILEADGVLLGGQYRVPGKPVDWGENNSRKAVCSGRRTKPRAMGKVKSDVGGFFYLRRLPKHLRRLFVQ